MWVSGENIQTEKRSMRVHNTMQHKCRTQQPFKQNARLLRTWEETHIWRRVCVCMCVCVITKITGDVMEHGEPRPPLAIFLTNQDSIAVAYRSHSCQRLKIPASGPLFISFTPYTSETTYKVEIYGSQI